MALKTLDVVIDDEGRDKGKRFRITEMPAMQGAKWAMRALLALGRSGIEVPDDLVGGGMASIAYFGAQILQTMRFEDTEPLLDEMMGCVQICPDPRNTSIVRPLVMAGVGDDLEEWATIFRLHKEAIGLHLDFFMRGAPSTGDTSKTPAPASENASTSPAQSRSSSLRGRRRSTS
jgi:hypothetical protein